MLLTTLALLTACEPGIRRVELQPSDPNVPLTRVLDVRLTRSAPLRIGISDSRGERVLHVVEAARRHQVPLLGVRSLDEVELVVTALDQEEHLSYQADGLPYPFPTLDQLILEPDRVEPGLRLLPLELADGELDTAYLVAVDPHLEPVWVWRAPRQLSAIHPTERGTILTVGGGMVWEVTLLGEVLQQWGEDPSEAVDERRFTVLEAGTLNHDVVPTEDGGFWTLGTQLVDAAIYPCAYDSPRRGCGRATVLDGLVLHAGAGGTIEQSWSLAEQLDTFRISYDALDDKEMGRAKDWAHPNGVTPHPDGGVVVSLRNQDAVVHLDSDGQLVWSLGDPAGWRAPWSDTLLQPVGELSWPYHQHGPSFDEHGQLWLFDNHLRGHTPYSPTTGREWDQTSRVVAYEIDADERTVREVAVYEDTATGPLLSRAVGNAAKLPETGNVLGLYGSVRVEDGVDNGALGFGLRSTRLVEWSADGSVVSDLRIRSQLSESIHGWRTYTVLPVPSLYPPGYRLEWLAPAD